MQPPQRDKEGKTIPHDHAEILDKDFVIRRISERQISTDELTGKRRISSLAFKPSAGSNASMSVDIEKLIIDAKLDPHTFVSSPRWIGSIRINVGDIRSTKCMVGFDPIEPPDPNPNPYHGGVWGNFSKSTQKTLRKSSSWYVEIPNVSIVE
jgi:hypothetical protein